MEFQDPSWHVDETFAALASAGAALCATELPEDEAPPTIRRTGPFLYLRLRRHDYTTADLAAWAARLEPFLAGGRRRVRVLPPRRGGPRRGAGARVRGRWADPRRRASGSRGSLRGSEGNEQRQRARRCRGTGAGRRPPRRRSSRAGRRGLVADRDPAATGDDVVELVLGVRLLEVRLARPRGRRARADRSGTVMNSRYGRPEALRRAATSASSWASIAGAYQPIRALAAFASGLGRLDLRQPKTHPDRRGLGPA